MNNSVEYGECDVRIIEKYGKMQVFMKEKKVKFQIKIMQKILEICLQKRNTIQLNYSYYLLWRYIFWWLDRLYSCELLDFSGYSTMKPLITVL